MDLGWRHEFCGYYGSRLDGGMSLYANRNPHFDVYQHADRYDDKHTHEHCDEYADQLTDFDHDGYAHRYCNEYRHPYRNSHFDDYGYPYPHTDQDADSDSFGGLGYAFQGEYGPEHLQSAVGRLLPNGNTDTDWDLRDADEHSKLAGDHRGQYCGDVTRG